MKEEVGEILAVPDCPRSSGGCGWKFFSSG
jgi:hypothetical protein